MSEIPPNAEMPAFKKRSHYEPVRCNDYPALRFWVPRLPIYTFEEQ